MEAGFGVLDAVGGDPVGVLFGSPIVGVVGPFPGAKVGKVDGLSDGIDDGIADG